MAAGPLTPGEEPDGTGTASSWAIGSIAYDGAFENSVMRAVLTPPPADGIVLLTDGDDDPKDAPSSIRSAIDISTLPSFALQELPLQLNHPSRIYRSPVPGIRYTQPGGALEGGAGPDAAERTEFAQQLIEEHRVRRSNNFWQVVEKDKQDALKELQDRMRAREKAMKQNEDIEARLMQMKEQRDLEVRVWERRMGTGKG